MDGLNFLTVLSGAMFIGSYSAGYVPLMFSMSESRMRMISIFGAGLLVGTALSVIIPEGVESLYNAQSDVHDREFHGVNNPVEAKKLLEETNVHQSQDEMPRIVPQGAKLNSGIEKVKREVQLESNANESVRVKRESQQNNEHVHVHEHGGHGDGSRGHGHGIHQKIGLSLVFGFVFMLLVDQISNSTISRNDRSGRSRMGISATIGLVVHAAADGIALGSASTINKSDVQLIVFIAIMLHKAPAAFGLVSFLLLEGIDHRTIKKHLLVFAVAAPLAGIITYVIIQNSGDTLSSSEAHTGVLMLFSAGTFLYVATVHVLPELSNKNGSNYSPLDQQTQAGHSHGHGGASFTIKELCSIIGGAVVPAILASGHSH